MTVRWKSLLARPFPCQDLGLTGTAAANLRLSLFECYLTAQNTSITYQHLQIFSLEYPIRNAGKPCFPPLGAE